MNRISVETKLTIQVVISIVLIIAGLILLFIGFFTPPHGEIHDSVLVAYGEVSTFAGALLGIDYSYKFRRYKIDRFDEYHERHYGPTEEIEKYDNEQYANDN